MKLSYQINKGNDFKYDTRQINIFLVFSLFREVTDSKQLSHCIRSGKQVIPRKIFACLALSQRKPQTNTKTLGPSSQKEHKQRKNKNKNKIQETFDIDPEKHSTSWYKSVKQTFF